MDAFKLLTIGSKVAMTEQHHLMSFMTSLDLFDTSQHYWPNSKRHDLQMHTSKIKGTVHNYLFLRMDIMKIHVTACIREDCTILYKLVYKNYSVSIDNLS